MTYQLEELPRTRYMIVSSAGGFVKTVIATTGRGGSVALDIVTSGERDCMRFCTEEAAEKAVGLLQLHYLADMSAPSFYVVPRRPA